MRRTPTDGRPYYCAACGLGFEEFLACEDSYCELETQGDAQARVKDKHKRPDTASPTTSSAAIVQNMRLRQRIQEGQTTEWVRGSSATRGVKMDSLPKEIWAWQSDREDDHNWESGHVQGWDVSGEPGDGSVRYVLADEQREVWAKQLLAELDDPYFLLSDWTKRVVAFLRGEP